MSIVSNYASETAGAALRRQRRNAKVSSLIISILTIVLLGLVLALILLPSLFLESPTIVTYQNNAVDEEKIERPEMNPQIQRKPSAPSSSMAKVIASITPSPTAIPVPEVDVPEPSTDFGSGDDFGDGWGDGSGSGGGGGGTTFFGQRSNAERIAYVIDYSQSMKGERERLMRKELSDSLKKLPYDAKFQLIFFAGPAWVGGGRGGDGQGKQVGGREGGQGAQL